MQKILTKYWWVVVLAAVVAYWYFKGRKASETAASGATGDTATQSANINLPEPIGNGMGITVGEIVGPGNSPAPVTGGNVPASSSGINGTTYTIHF